MNDPLFVGLNETPSPRDFFRRGWRGGLFIFADSAQRAALVAGGGALLAAGGALQEREICSDLIAATGVTTDDLVMFDNPRPWFLLHDGSGTCCVWNGS